MNRSHAQAENLTLLPASSSLKKICQIDHHRRCYIGSFSWRNFAENNKPDSADLASQQSGILPSSKLLKATRFLV
jgi:hypothetical protein